MALSTIIQFLPILTLVVLLGMVLASIRWSARRRLRKLNEEAKTAGAQLVSFLKECQLQLQHAVGQRGVSREQMTREIEEILASMEARSIDGNLDEIIREERQWAYAEIDRRIAT